MSSAHNTRGQFFLNFESVVSKISRMSNALVKTDPVIPPHLPPSRIPTHLSGVVLPHAQIALFFIQVSLKIKPFSFIKCNFFWHSSDRRQQHLNSINVDYMSNFRSIRKDMNANIFWFRFIRKLNRQLLLYELHLSLLNSSIFNTMIVSRHITSTLWTTLSAELIV